MIRVVRSFEEALPGDLIRDPSGDGVSFRRCPKCKGFQSIANHQVDWQAVTVTPSLLCNISRGPGQECQAHYFITAGEVVWV